MTQRRIGPKQLPANYIDLTGQRFGRLAVLHRAPVTAKWITEWECRCDCGTITTVRANHLRRGAVQSCGCLYAAMHHWRAFKHGLSNTAEYRIWAAMNARCTNPKHVGWKHYGGRGIRVDPAWRHDFSAWLRAVGPRPSLAHSLDRIDSNRHYEPGNVRWATGTEQVNNRRCNVVIVHNGRAQTISQWAREIGIDRNTLKARLKHGWLIERALTTPPQP